MSTSKKAVDNVKDDVSTSQPEPAQDHEVSQSPTEPPLEIGGRDGPDPTRYGDWEKNGRCIDF